MVQTSYNARTASCNIDSMVTWSPTVQQGDAVGRALFLQAAEFTCPGLTHPQCWLLGMHVSMDSHTNPQCLTVAQQVWSFWCQWMVYVSRTFRVLCPVSAVLSIHPSSLGPFFLFEDGTPLSWDRLVSALTQALASAGIDASGFTGHSFRIGAVTGFVLVLWQAYLQALYMCIYCMIWLLSTLLFCIFNLLYPCKSQPMILMV